MPPKQLTPDFSVSAQISVSEVSELAKAGFKSILCNRPDDESPGQTNFAEVEAAAKAAGLAVGFVPVISGRMTRDDVVAFDAAFASLPRPILAYCRSGTRCTMLWALSSEETLSGDQREAAAAAQGYDVSALVRR